MNFFYLPRMLYFSKPTHQRVLYKYLLNNPLSSIVEIGLGNGESALETLNFIEYCQKKKWKSRNPSDRRLRYTGIDLFEMGKKKNLTLKETYQKLRQTSAQIRLLPGTAQSVLPRYANTLLKIDLILISNEESATSLQESWRYLPRMLHPRSVLFWEQGLGESSTLKKYTFGEIQREQEEKRTAA
ncbi:MAG: hypothetical protein MPJ24_00670 [Pirellulaceae bacterium]|nr:hypothetical protein [Pirellulaceae bacterium]